MRLLVHPVIVPVVLTVLLQRAVSQNPVLIQTSPVLATSGGNAVLTVVTVTDVLSVSWASPGGETLGLWVGGSQVINPVAQYQGRVTLTPMQLEIRAVQLKDAGNYTVTVDPKATTGMSRNSAFVAVSVFDAVNGVSLLVPAIAREGSNASLSCSWGGTGTSVIWGKGGSAIASNSRVTVTGGSLVINPLNRGDADVYTCTVSNPVSAETATARLTVYYGPDAPSLTQDVQADCVGGGQAVVGQTMRLTCTSISLPPALFSWKYNGVPMASDQPGSGVLSLQTFSTNQSGRYACVASNAVMEQTAEQGADITVVRTCLSGGAVAGIVIGCALAVILIIVAIFLLLCWRNVDRRLRHVTKMAKPAQNPSPRTLPDQPALPLPGSHTHAPSRGSVRDWRLGPPLHDPDPNQHNVYMLPPNSHRNPNAFPDPSCSEVLQPDRLQGPNMFTNDGQHDQTTLIQIGHTRGGLLPPTVNVNLNQFPHTVSQWDPHPLRNTNQVPYVDHRNPDGLPHTEPSGPAGLRQTDLDPPTPVGNGTHALIQTGFSHLTGHTPTNQRNANTQTRWSDPRQQQLPTEPRPAPPEARQEQKPWDHLRDTPAYPEHPAGAPQRLTESSEESSEDQSRGGPSHPGRQQLDPAVFRPTRLVSAAVTNRNAETLSGKRTADNQRPEHQANIPLAPQTRNSQLPVATLNQNSLRPNTPQEIRQVHQAVRTLEPHMPSLPQSAGGLNPSPLTRAALQMHTTQNPSPYRDRVDQTRAALQMHTTQNPTPIRDHADQTRAALQMHTTQNPTPIRDHADQTRAALQMHTTQNPTPIRDRADQTEAALTHRLDPKLPSLPKAASPVQRRPTPPPVLSLSQFNALPQQPLQQPRAGRLGTAHTRPKAHRHLVSHRQAPGGRP